MAVKYSGHSFKNKFSEIVSFDPIKKISFAKYLFDDLLQDIEALLNESPEGLDIIIAL